MYIFDLDLKTCDLDNNVEIILMLKIQYSHIYDLTYIQYIAI